MKANGKLKTTLFTIFVLVYFTILVHAGPADLDITFDTDGKVTTDLGGHDLGRGVVQQPDGKLVVAGRSLSAATDNDFGVARYNIDGSLDANFGSGGKVRTDFATTDEEPWGIALQSDGKIVVVGGSDLGGDYDFAVVRYNPDGTLDTTFGTNGIVTTDIAGDSDEARAVVVQPDGKIVAIGTTFDVSSSTDNFALARYNADGSLDTTFGFGGKVNTDLPGTENDEAFGAALQSDGKIIAVGRRINSSDPDFAIARYNPDGSLDTSFDNDGTETTDFAGLADEAFGVAVQNDGKIVVVGGTDTGVFYDFALARYNTNGSLDTSFSFDGKVTTDFASDFDEAISVVLQPDGKIIAAGVTSAGSVGNFGLARYNPDGILDINFDIDGKVITDFGANDAPLSVALQTDGKIVAAGYSITLGLQDGDFAIARYEGDPLPLCIYCDDFQDGIPPTDWTYVKPQWNETGGNLIGIPTGKKAEAIASPAFGGCTNCSVQSSMSTAGGLNNKVWLLAWYVDKKTGVELLMKEENDKWVLKQRSGGSIVAKVSAQATILPNVFYDVEITFDGTNFTLIVDGVTLATTSAFTTPNGTVGFRAKSTTASFAHITVN